MFYAWFSVAIIVIVTYIVFSPSLQNRFTNWDDNVYVQENPLVVANTLPVKEIFKTPVSSNYHPITILSLAWNFQNEKLEPKGYHEINIMFHLLNTLLVFFFIFILSRRNLLMSIIVALFFGIHPMHVESVSWISERKDVLYVFFFLVGMITYLYYKESKKTAWYIFTLLLFILSCLSKAMAVVFPVILLLIDYLQGVKWTRKVFIEKIPFVIISLVFGIAAFKIQSESAITDTNFFTVFKRIMFASYGAIMYLVKFVLPINLSSYYPYPTLNKNESIPFVFYLYPFIFSGIIAIVYYFFRKEKPVIFGMLFYFVSVALVLQFISVGTVIMADRYSYLSYIGLLYVFAYYFDKAWQNKKGSLSVIKYPLVVITIIAAISFCFQTYARTQVWKDSETLWTDVINKIGNISQSDKAYVGRGKYYRSIGEENKAVDDYKSAIRVNPSYSISYNNLANIYRSRGQVDSALADYNIAIALDPKDYLSYSNRALIYKDMKEYDKAKTDFERSISLNPNYWANYYNRGLYYFDLNKDEEAITDYNRAVQLNYLYADIYYWRGLSYWRLKRYEESINDYSRAIELNPSIGNYWLHRSISESALNKTDEAKSDMARGLQLLGIK